MSFRVFDGLVVLLVSTAAHAGQLVYHPVNSSINLNGPFMLSLAAADNPRFLQSWATAPSEASPARQFKTQITSALLARISGTITFDDEFNTLSLHRIWQQGDKWQLIAPDSTGGRGGPKWGEGGSQWWVNPFNPNTAINGIYSVSNGMLNLRLLPTPSQYQSYIDRAAGAHMPFIGALLNSSPTNYQHFGYWEIGVSSDRVPGFAFEMALENVQLTGHWPPQLTIGVSTDGSGRQTLQAHMYAGRTSSDYSRAIDGTQQHDYGIDWEADFITFYFDNTKVFQVPNPGGVYQTDKMFAYLYTGANYSHGTGVNPPTSSLPANARIDYFRVYTAKP